MIQAVIFDMDGVLIDTEKYYCRCWKQAFAEFGYEMTDEQAMTTRSLGRPHAPLHYKKMFGDGVDYPAVRKRRQELVEACIRTEGIQRKKGVMELLNFLKDRGIQTAVATSTDTERTNRCLQLAGLENCFDHLYTAVMVKEGKPSPDVYLYACEQLGLPPEACMAVEDSPNGVLSAWQAGCKVVMVPDLTRPTEEMKPMLYACVEDLTRMMELFEAPGTL